MSVARRRKTRRRESREKRRRERSGISGCGGVGWKGTRIRCHQTTKRPRPRIVGILGYRTVLGMIVARSREVVPRSLLK
jgi:hypothetical protein